MNFELSDGCSTAGPLKLKPWRSIFRDKDHGWSPLLWVLYLGFFFIDPVFGHASLRLWLLDIAGADVHDRAVDGLHVLLQFGELPASKCLSLESLVGIDALDGTRTCTSVCAPSPSMAND